MINYIHFISIVLVLKILRKLMRIKLFKGLVYVDFHRLLSSFSCHHNYISKHVILIQYGNKIVQMEITETNLYQEDYFNN